MRVHNFNPGPSALPKAVLERVAAEFMDYQSSGMSIIETSHRSPAYAALHEETKNFMRELMKIPQDYEILFTGGGATLQFAMVPLNLLARGGTAAYVLTGNWANKAFEEATKVGKEAVVLASSKDENYNYLPDLAMLKPEGTLSYVHVTSNNTIYGTQYREFPKLHAPMVCDMSSDIFTHPIAVENFALIYAGAQKNIGPAGVTVVIAKKEVLDSAPDGLPTYLRYKTHLSKDSLYNTPPVFSIYVLHHVMAWLKEQGGLNAVHDWTASKANALYDAIDNSGGFYKGTAKTAARSWQNVTFRLADEKLEANFLEEAQKVSLVGLKGHRSVGGMRASIYNGVSKESVDALVSFMNQFKTAHG